MDLANIFISKEKMKEVRLIKRRKGMTETHCSVCGLEYEHCLCSETHGSCRDF